MVNKYLQRMISICLCMILCTSIVHQSDVLISVISLVHLSIKFVSYLLCF